MENNYVGPLPRLAALLIDALLITAIANILILRPNTFPGLIDMRVLIISISYIAYEALMIYYLGWTVGKRMIGAKIVDVRHGERPSLLRCSTRPWAKLFFGLVILNSTIIGFMFLLYSVLNFSKMVSSEEQRAIHDIVAGTVVLSSSPKGSMSE